MEKGQGKGTDTLQTDNVFTRKEYIEREAALSAQNKSMNLAECRKRLERQPAADVVPARHGRWVVSRTDYSWNGAEYPTHCKCDQCGREIPYLDRDAYCPTCGALMDKDGDGE